MTNLRNIQDVKKAYKRLSSLYYKQVNEVEWEIKHLKEDMKFAYETGAANKYLSLEEKIKSLKKELKQMKREMNPLKDWYLENVYGREEW